MPAAEQPEPTSLDVALSYARRGWRVIPIPSGEKFPRGITAWQTEGSTDEAKITHWWTAAPDHGIGIVTGATSGLWVLDVDVAGDKVGDETLADLCDAYGPLPDTYEVVTGSGGRHLYFAWPGGQIVTNSASGRLGPGLDVRGEGGFVVAPPSLHACGQRYEHEASSPTHVAAAPPWMLALLEAPEPAATPTPRQASGPAGDRPGDLWAAQTTWAQILEPDGWTLHHVSSDGEEHWTRPGKERRDGTSATTGYLGSDVLKVFTSSHPTLNADETYTKLGYLASTRHHGDHSAAAAALRNDGWKAPDTRLAGLLAPGMAAPAAATTATPAEPWQEPQPLPAPPSVPDFPLTSLPATPCVGDGVGGFSRSIKHTSRVCGDREVCLRHESEGTASSRLTGFAPLRVYVRSIGMLPPTSSLCLGSRLGCVAWLVVDGGEVGVVFGAAVGLSEQVIHPVGAGLAADVADASVPCEDAGVALLQPAPCRDVGPACRLVCPWCWRVGGAGLVVDAAVAWADDGGSVSHHAWCPPSGRR